MAADTTYVSQQQALFNSMVAYMQSTGTWPDGIPKVTDYTPGSIAFTLFSAISVGMDALSCQLFFARLSAYISTAIGEDLDNKVADYGLTRNQATNASGTFTFSRNNPASYIIPIPAGTLTSTIPTENAAAIIYATREDAEIGIGETEVDSVATSQEVGTQANISAGTLLLVASGVAGVDNVSLAISITDGSDVESDASLRARGLAAFVALAHGTITSYEQIVLAVAGVTGAIVVPQGRGPGTVDIYIMGPNNSIPTEEVQTEAQLAIDGQKVATDDVQVLLPEELEIDADISIHLAAGFDADATSEAVVTAISEYIASLGVGASGVGYIYNSQLVAAALSVSGVINATSTFVDLLIEPAEMPIANDIEITVV